jgi:hypothetical protein
MMSRQLGTTALVLCGRLLLMAVLASPWIPAAHAYTLPVEADTHVDRDRPGLNLGHEQNLVVEGDAAGVRMVGLVRFSLESLRLSVDPGDLAHAEIRFWVDAVGRSGSLGVYSLTTLGSWNEATVNWDKTPALDAAPVAVVDLTSAADRQYVAIDLTPTVRSWLATGGGGEIALAPVEAGDDLLVAIDAKEGTGTSHPMTVEILTYGPAGADGSSCSAVQDAAGNNIVACTDGTSFPVRDGRDGSSCSVTQNADGNYLLIQMEHRLL